MMVRIIKQFFYIKVNIRSEITTIRGNEGLPSAVKGKRNTSQHSNYQWPKQKHPIQKRGNYGTIPSQQYISVKNYSNFNQYSIFRDGYSLPLNVPLTIISNYHLSSKIYIYKIV